MNYLVRSSSGEIVRGGSCSKEDLKLQAGEGEVAEEATGNFNDLDHYHDGGAYVDRPAFDLQPTPLNIDTSQSLLIGNIPAGTLVKHPDGELIVDDDFLEWSCAEPGDYEFTFENFPYIPETLIATVTSA
jgi:hypothetical protein